MLPAFAWRLSGRVRYSQPNFAANCLISGRLVSSSKYIFLW